MTNLQELAGVLDMILEDMIGKRSGFCLLVFPFGEEAHAGADYISNGKREDMIKFLRETADRLEAKDDIGETMGNA